MAIKVTGERVTSFEGGGKYAPRGVFRTVIFSNCSDDEEKEELIKKFEKVPFEIDLSALVKCGMQKPGTITASGWVCQWCSLLGNGPFCSRCHRRLKWQKIPPAQGHGQAPPRAQCSPRREPRPCKRSGVRVARRR